MEEEDWVSGDCPWGEEWVRGSQAMVIACEDLGSGNWNWAVVTTYLGSGDWN